MPTPPIKITEAVRSVALRRPLRPAVIRDSEISGFALHVTQKRAFWALTYQPRGVRPDGRRWGGGTRHEFCSAEMMSVSDARGTALALKSAVRQGRSPHHEAMASRANSEASRAIVPTTAGEALDDYAKGLAGRTTPSAWSRRQAVHYARKAIRLMRAETSPLATINLAMVRLLFETMTGSQAEKQQVYSGLRRFLTWARRQDLIAVNACDLLERDERPKPGKPRSNVPSLEELRAVWAAVESESANPRDAVRLLLLTACRRDEIVELPWHEVDFVNRRLVIPGERMKNGEEHQVPLSQQALAILKARVPAAPHALVFPSSAGKPLSNWGTVLTRIRKAIGEAHLPKAQRFVFHDIRRSFVSLLSDEFDVDALDRAIAHKRTGVAAIYNLSTRMDARIAAMTKWANLLLDAPEPVEAEPSNVVPLPRRANV